MSDLDNALAEATDDLIALYKSIERRTLDLPFVSFMPILIFFWAFLKLEFFLVIGFFLIIPTNLVILVRNLFPGHWKYRPFFLRHVKYGCLWVWRGEGPIAPSIFIRPLLNIFMKGHFANRLRRLRLEILLRDGLSDTTRSALLARLDAALERWKSPRFRAIFFTVLLPGIISLPSWYKQLLDFLGSFGMHMPTDMIANFVSNMPPGNLLYFGLTALGYLLGISVTGFLAKRGLFIGMQPNRICFPGGQGGSGAYLKEREILGKIELRVSETPIDLWFAGIGITVGTLSVVLAPDYYLAWVKSSFSEYQGQASELLNLSIIIYWALFITIAAFGLITVAALRRRRTGRA